MEKNNNKNKARSRRHLTFAIICILALAVVMSLCMLMPMSKSDEVEYIYIDADDNIDSLSAKVGEKSHGYSMTAFNMLARHLNLKDRLSTGRYQLEETTNAIAMVRRLRNHQQAPVRLVIPSVRTADRLAEELSKHLMLSSDSLYSIFTDNERLKTYGVDTATVLSLFIPNTYEVYWNIGTEKFMERMKHEGENFWSDARKQKAAAANLSPLEVMIVASIVDEETANNAEKPMVAGMYLNRLEAGMPLQADPTIKFALKDFSIKRIYKNMLTVDSPYNTYKNVGLPPAPIRIPSVAAIDAVLNHVDHDYMYMCAKEDFSGTHNFARTYKEHLENAHKYSDALNKRGIK